MITCMAHVNLMPTADNRSLLVVTAHPDDECIGTGGTIRRHVNQGAPVDVLCLTGNRERNLELSAACKALGVRKVLTSERDDYAIDWSLERRIVDTILESKPEIVITHSSLDYNRSHTECSKIVEDAVEWASHITQFPNAHRVRQILNMEVNSLLPGPNVMVDISEDYDAVVSALRKHKSQMSKANSFYERFYDARTRLRGVQAGCERAEAFLVVLSRHAGPFYPVNAVTSLL